MKTELEIDVTLSLEIFFEWEPEQRPRYSMDPDLSDPGTPAYGVVESVWLEGEEIKPGPLWDAIMTHKRTPIARKSLLFFNFSNTDLMFIGI